MRKRTLTKFLWICAAVFIFTVCLAGIRLSDQNQENQESVPENLQIQQYSPSFPEGQIYSESEADERLYQSADLLATVGQSDWKAVSATSKAAALSFSDVRASDWFYNEVMWAVGEGITNGLGENRFGPQTTCNNAQFLTFLWRSYGMPDPSGSNPFSDVSTDNYFFRPALWAFENGLVSGSTLSPEKDCTRAMVVDYLWKAAGLPTIYAAAQFDDVPADTSVSQAVSWAVENGITTGVSRTEFSPETTCTRAQIVTFLYRDAAHRNTSNESITLPTGVSYKGMTLDGAPHGKGVLVIPDIGYYDGYFEHGQKHGTGAFFWTSGESYSGTWSRDEISGTGKLVLSGGDILSGNFSDGNLTQGTYSFSQDYGTVEVPVSGGKLQSSGEIKFSLSDGSVYSGHIANGKLNGSCTITFANGDKYTGNVTDNLKSGNGTYTWKNGAWYEGSWLADEMSGTGTYYYTASSTGERLQGTFSHNDPTGVCTYFSSANTKYTTTWSGRQCIAITRG